MRRLWSANLSATAHRRNATSDGGQGNNQVRARGTQSSLQIHHRTADRKYLRLPPDVGIERVIARGSAKGLSGVRANRVRRQGQLPHQCSVSSVVAIRDTDVRTH